MAIPVCGNPWAQKGIPNWIPARTVPASANNQREALACKRLAFFTACGTGLAANRASCAAARGWWEESRNGTGRQPPYVGRDSLGPAGERRGGNPNWIPASAKNRSVILCVFSGRFRPETRWPRAAELRRCGRPRAAGLKLKRLDSPS